MEIICVAWIIFFLDYEGACGCEFKKGEGQLCTFFCFNNRGIRVPFKSNQWQLRHLLLGLHAIVRKPRVPSKSDKPGRLENYKTSTRPSWNSSPRCLRIVLPAPDQWGYSPRARDNYVLKHGQKILITTIFKQYHGD